ncbi:MAG: hypothetical protein EHM58_10540 [Ignavibacteriae bacterium]|nr:MAG: hypothetical protein EHM58_10540 [Ignavibacteriota bacterium]
MKSLLFVLLILLVSSVVYSQTDTTIWNDLTTIEGENYTFSVPSKWRNKDMTAYGMLHWFEASGLAYPITFQGNPIIVVVSFVKMEQQSVEEVKESIQRGYSQNKDRVFPHNYNYDSKEVILKSGEKAYIIHTKFYRKSKFLNQSRFDLGVYSDKYKQGYMYTISIQYADDSYQFEKDYRLSEFAEKLYTYFTFK